MVYDPKFRNTLEKSKKDLENLLSIRNSMEWKYGNENIMMNTESKRNSNDHILSFLEKEGIGKFKEWIKSVQRVGSKKTSKTLIPMRITFEN